MAIAGIDEEQLGRILRENLTPSDTIKTPERLFGREKSLTTIRRALNSQGRQIFIYGDRGVGKTSLALTSAFMFNSAGLEPIVVRCGSTSSFGEVLQSIGNRCVPLADQFVKKQTRAAFNFTLPTIGGIGFTPGKPGEHMIAPPGNINQALDIVRFVQHCAGEEQMVVVIDEMERLNTKAEKEKFAEFIKNVPEVSETVRFIFCGISSDVSELLGAHPSAGRVLETIDLKRLHHDSLWEIITTTAEKLGVEVDREKLIRIGQISDGFPHYVHLIGESLFWTIFDAEEVVAKVGTEHFRIAIRKALERTEPILRAQFDQATKKTKNTSDYEEALWAMADTTSDRRQLTEIYDSSYCRIMLRRSDRERLSKEVLNQRLLALKKESHGRVLVGHGSGWFSFRENIMRGYVRLDAENHGVELGRDVS